VTDAEVKAKGQVAIHFLYDRNEASFVESAAWDDDYYINPVECRMFLQFFEMCYGPIVWDEEDLW